MTRAGDLVGLTWHADEMRRLLRERRAGWTA